MFATAKNSQFILTANRIRRWDSEGRESRYAYDGKGNLLRETERLDGAGEREIRYEYDQYGRVTVNALLGCHDPALSC